MTSDAGKGSRRSMSDPGCTTIREVLARVGDKWSVFVVTLLGERTMRFTELQRSIEGISQRMLTLTLRQLERDGLVERVVYPIVPPRVEYSLTALGTTLLDPLLALAGWADAHRTDIERARVAYDSQPQASQTPWLTPSTEESAKGRRGASVSM
jgi:DNA-binding HxlR family transcriptional regulator